MKSTSLNRKLLVLVVTALLLGALALVNPAQRELTLENAQINSADIYKIAGEDEPPESPDPGGTYVNT